MNFYTGFDCATANKKAGSAVAKGYGETRERQLLRREIILCGFKIQALYKH